MFLRADNFATLHASALFRVYVATANAIITKIADKYSYTLGENVRYTVKVTNNGPDTIDAVKIIDTWPNTSCIAADSLRSSNMPMTIISASNPYIWTLNTSLPAGQSVYLYLT